MPRVKISLQYDKHTILAMIAYFEALLSDKFPVETKNKFESAAGLDILEQKAREIVENLIYDAYPDPGGRTFDLLNSVMVIKGGIGSQIEYKTGQVNLLSDPEVASAKYHPTMSYLAFFEKPEEYNTFIHPRGVASNPVNFRPFFSTWTKMVQQHTEKMAIEAINTTLDNLMPNILKATVSP